MASMDNMFNQIVTAIGAIAEMWTIAYKSFLNQGFSEKEALVHTQALIKSIISTNNGGNNND